jgi:hypothetical protein
MTQTTPYIPRNPGDILAAEDWNRSQILIKDDIATQIAAAKDDIKHTGVDQAGNATKFAGKSETEWTTSLDERYAPKVHNHEGQSVYRRYLKEFSGKSGMDTALLRHRLGRFPLVDLYELQTVTTVGGVDYRLFLYYGHLEAEKFGLVIQAGRDRLPLGIPLEQVLLELDVYPQGDDDLRDVINEMWDAFRRDPNDEIPHGQSEEVDERCTQQRTVDQLKKSGEWDDLLVAIKPVKCTKGVHALADDFDVTHIDYDTVLLETHGLPDTPPRDLMILLRI